MYEKASEIGLDEGSDAEVEFSRAGYEMECAIVTDPVTGLTKMIGIKDAKTGMLVDFVTPLNI